MSEDGMYEAGEAVGRGKKLALQVGVLVLR